MDEASTEEAIERAIERYQRVERLLADFDKALSGVEVTVRSPDGLVEVLVGADGAIRDVVISDTAHGRTPRELSRSVAAAVAAAGEAAGWARAKLHQEMFADFRPLGQQRELGHRSDR